MMDWPKGCERCSTIYENPNEESIKTRMVEMNDGHVMRAYICTNCHEEETVRDSWVKQMIEFSSGIVYNREGFLGYEEVAVLDSHSHFR